MNKEIKEFKKYKRKCNRKLFDIIDKNSLKKEIKKLEYSEDNLKRIKAIEEKLHTIPEIRYNRFLYDFILKMLKSKKEEVNRYYKVLECDNFLNYNPLMHEHSDYCTRKDALLFKYIPEDNFNLYLKMVNNKLFLKNDINNNPIKSEILSLFRKIDNNKSIKNLVDIATDTNYWNKYEEVEKYHIIELFQKDRNNAKYTQLIYTLSHQNYFRDDKQIGNEVLYYTKYFTKRNYDGLIQLVNNLDSEEALKNIIKVKRVIEKISEIKSPKQSIELANIASNPKVLNKDVQEIERTLRRIENKETLEQLKKELNILSITEEKQKQYTKK